MINNLIFKAAFNNTFGFWINAKMKDLDTSMQGGYKVNKVMASRELGSTGLRGTLFYDKILSPTVEPDPDNAGGGKLQLTSRPSLGGFFYPATALI
jgi:hypothetical protein